MTEKPTPSDAELIEHARAVGMVEPERAPEFVAAYRARIEQLNAAVSPPTVAQLDDAEPTHQGPHPEYGHLETHRGHRENCSGPDCGPDPERSYWQDIADALNAAETAGMPVGIDLDGTLTDRDTWSVVWDRDAELWKVADYEDEPEGTKEAPAAEQPTDGVESPEDAARRFARRLRAVELLCAGRPGYHTVTVKALLTAIGGEAPDESQEQPPGALLDPFTEAAIRHSALLCGALAIEALPQDHECDPGRGDSVKLLRRLAGLTSTTEQPTGLTWEARAEHAVRLYATTAIELEDARAELAKLRDERDEAGRDADRYAARIDTARALHTRRADSPHCEHDAEQWPCPTVAALDRDDQAGTAAPLTAAELEQGQADAEHPDTIASLVDEIADDIPHRRAPQIAAAYLARHRTLVIVERDSQIITWLGKKAREYRSTGSKQHAFQADAVEVVASKIARGAVRADAVPAPLPAAAEQPLAFPQLAVPCPRCESPAGVLCTSHSGTRQRTTNTHQDRTRAYRATQAGR